MLPMFIASGRRNYAIESMQILMQHEYLLSPQEAAELVWSRFVDVRGCPGWNIANDLHMQHLLVNSFSVMIIIIITSTRKTIY